MAEVAVIGGGITGLAAAWFLLQRDPSVRVTVHEAGDRFGGKIQTGSLDGVGGPVEAGPDTFLARVPWATDLCRQLGLGDELTTPATGKAYIWTRGALRPIPEGTVLGVPKRLEPLAESGIVSAAGLARAAEDLDLPRSGFGADPTVAEVVGARFGGEVVDRLVEPLLGGIHAGTADHLSLASVAPQVAEAAGGSEPSLMRALARLAEPPPGPVFHGLRGGLGRLVERLVERLREAGAELRIGSWVMTLGAGPTVLTVPAFAAAPLVRPLSGEAADLLAGIGYASVVTVTLAYPRDAFAGPLDGSGFLVPRVDGRLVTACTWTSAKWPDAGGGDGPVVLRASSGRRGDERAMAMDDAALVAQVHAELVEAMGLRAGRPVASLVTRWPRGFPQYDSGHAARVDRVEALLAPHGVVLAGAAYRGLGIAACIRQAGQAAAAVGLGSTR